MTEKSIDIIKTFIIILLYDIINAFIFPNLSIHKMFSKKTFKETLVFYLLILFLGTMNRTLDSYQSMTNDALLLFFCQI